MNRRPNYEHRIAIATVSRHRMLLVAYQREKDAVERKMAECRANIRKAEDELSMIEVRDTVPRRVVYPNTDVLDCRGVFGGDAR